MRLLPQARPAVLAMAALLVTATPAIADQVAPPSQTPDLFARAVHVEVAVRLAAVPELAAYNHPRANEWLRYMVLKDQSPQVRAAAAEALGNLEHGGAVATLEVAAKTDSDPAVRKAAKGALDKLTPFTKSPGRAALFGVLCPGCGHFYLGRHRTGAAYLAAAGTMLGTGIYFLSDANDFSGIENFASDADDPIGLILLSGAQNLWFYGIFDAYRDARVGRGDKGYKIPISNESLGDLASAPFRPDVLKSPWVWAATPLAVAGGIGLLSLVSDDDLSSSRTLFDSGDVNFLGRNFSRPAGIALGELYWGSLFLPVGVGEEALFRGVLQPALSEQFGVWGGWATASLLFGAAHIANFTTGDVPAKEAAAALSYITFVGSGLGLAYIKTNFELETSVAMHFWYDFLLGTAFFVADPDNQPFTVKIGGAF